MGKASENASENIRRINEVNAVIRSFDAEPPIDGFTVKQSERNIKQSTQSAYLSLLCTGLLLMTTFMRLPDVNTARFLIVGCMFLMDIFMFITILFMKKPLAEVHGDSIIIKGKTYSYSDVTEFKGAYMNNLKIISGGKAVAAVNKSCDNCAELVKWAKYHGIAINDDPNVDPQKAQNNYMALLVVVMILAVFLGLFLGLRGR